MSVFSFCPTALWHLSPTYLKYKMELLIITLKVFYEGLEIIHVVSFSICHAEVINDSLVISLLLPSSWKVVEKEISRSRWNMYSGEEKAAEAKGNSPFFQCCLMSEMARGPVPVRSPPTQISMWFPNKLCPIKILCPSKKTFHFLGTFILSEWMGIFSIFTAQEMWVFRELAVPSQLHPLSMWL